MGDRDPNLDNLEAFNQELTETHVPRNKRRSSILKPVDNYLPEDRRQSRRISFHTNILCQQILPDGTTQVVTEALKAKLADTSASTISTLDRACLPEDENTSRKRSTTSSGNSASGQKKRKDPKEVAQCYQNFIKRTYDAGNDNDYDTVFNTSVNRNGFPVASRDQRLDITQLFSADRTDGAMDITKVLTSPDNSRVQKENDETGCNTKVFSDFSMSLEESLIDTGNVSEMDTAMIIDDDVFESSDENELSPAEGSKAEANETQPSKHSQVVAVEAAVIILAEESIGDVSMSIVSEQSHIASQEPVEKTKVFNDVPMEMTEAVNPDKILENQEKTLVFSQDASITIEKNFSKDVSPASSQELVLPAHASNPGPRDEDLFQDKSASFRNNKALTLAFSRVSFPRNLDKVLKLRREQMNRTLQTLKDADISSDIDSYSDSPSPCLQGRANRSIASPMHMPGRTTILFDKSSLAADSLDVSEMQEDVSTTGAVSAHTDAAKISGSECGASQNESHRQISPSTGSTDFLTSSSGSSGGSQESEPTTRREDVKQTITTKGSTSNFLSSTGITSFDESGSEGEVSGFDASLHPGDNTGEDEDEDNGNALHDDSLFEMYQGAESSFNISPDSSFHSSFICQDDTLLILGDDIDAKLNQFLQDSSLSSQTSPGKAGLGEDRDLTFVPLTKFSTARNGATLHPEDPNHLIVDFMFATIKVTVDLGTTVRSFNGIPIKVIKRIGIESSTKETDFLIQDDGRSLIDYSDEKMRGLFVIAHDMLISSFEECKFRMISQYSTSDQLSDLLSDISDLVKVCKEFLQELAIMSMLYPMQVYRKVGNEYDLAFQLPGRRRNFFLILAVDPATYPFTPIKVRFGFDREDRSLYHVNNFAKALSLVVKPGRRYITRMIDAAKKYVLISRKISRSKS